MTTPAQKFVADMLALIRRDFYACRPEKKFYQDRPDLTRAITEPARYLRDRGVARERATIGLIRRILATVIEAIKRHGNVAKIERFSLYFLHAVQRHLQIHGETYYMAAKAPRSVAGDVGRAMAKLDHLRSNAAPDSSVENLAEVNRVLNLGRRIRKAQKNSVCNASEMDLFRHCKRSAKRTEFCAKPLPK